MTLPRLHALHPRYEVHLLKDRQGAPTRWGIRDDDRGTYVRTLPLGTPERLVERVLADLTERFRPATVVYRQQWITSKLLEPWGFASVCGDVVEVTPRYRVVLDNGRNLHTIPAKHHVRTVWGATVVDHAPNTRYGMRNAIVTDRPDVIEGWTEPRHQELHYTVHNGNAATWFADFALRFGLAGKHFQWDQVAEAGRDTRPLISNGSAQLLLRHWNREHPDVWRRLYAK